MPRLGNVAFDRARAAVRIRAARRSISRVTHASKGLLSSADARHGHRAPAPRGACRFVARRLPQWMFNPGLRPSHVALRLDRHAHSGFPDAERRCFVKALQTIVPRLRKNQLVSALTVVARERISGSVLSSLLGHLQKPSCVHVLWQQPRKVAALVHQFSRPLGEPRDNVTLSTLQYIAKQLVVHADEFGEGGVIVFDSLARASGPVAFRRLLGDDMKQLITSIMSRAGISSDPCTVQMIGVGEQRISSVTVGVDLLCTVGRAGRQNTQLVATLCEYICDHIFVLDISRLPALAQCVCLGGQKDGGNQHDEFVLLHAICRRSLSHPQALSDDDLIILLQAFARADLFEEEFLEVVSCRICQGARQLHAGKLADTISCLGSLQVRDVQLLDALCSGVSSQVQDLQELDIVRCFRGLVRLRHTDHGILHALMPEVDRRKWLLTPLSLTNIISSLAFFGVMGEQFFAGMLGVVSSRISRLSSTSVQHVLTTLCREQGRMRNELLQEPMMAVCEFLATPTVAAQLTPVQAVGALSALAKLQCRNLSALSVLLSSLVGRGTNVVWTWAPSTNFYAHGRPGGSSPSAPFDEARCVNFLGSRLDASHFVEIVQGIHRLDLHGMLPLTLSRLVWEHLLRPQLHSLRAREVLAIALAVGATRLSVDCEEEQHFKENLARCCIESLRRHEHYLECAWSTVLPLKLLCLEIESGVFGSRTLAEILNLGLLCFVERLCALTESACEQNRLLREQSEGQEDAIGVHIETSEGVTSQVQCTVDANVAVGGGGNVRVAQLVHGFNVDVLIRRCLIDCLRCLCRRSLLVRVGGSCWRDSS